MSTVLTVASLAVREAVRRRLAVAFALISVMLVSLSGWGFYRLSHNAGTTSGETHIALPGAVILFMFMFSFVVALSASAIASPAISGELDSGVLQTVIARPVRRGEVLLGKWLGDLRAAGGRRNLQNRKGRARLGPVPGPHLGRHLPANRPVRPRPAPRHRHPQRPVRRHPARHRTTRRCRPG